MNLRDFIQEAELKRWIIHVDQVTPPNEKMARLIHQAGQQPIFFRSRWNGYRVLAGVCASRRHFALALGESEDCLLPRLVDALRHPEEPGIVPAGPCQEVVEELVDLDQLPILTHTRMDGGPYITAGIGVTWDPEDGFNAAYHRLMQLDSRRFAVRLVEGRGTHRAWSRASDDVPVAFCIGAPITFQLAAAMSPPAGSNELAVANALAPLPVVRCTSSDLLVPAFSEIILEGRITRELVDEGPFIDLTGTFDLIRPQPVVEIDRITHRADPIFCALLPGGPEHKLLMGMPREPTIFDAVSQVCECGDVNITPGGASWLHAVVQIRKQAPEDGGRAGEAAFIGHPSLKHVVVVDDDIDIREPSEVEWAIATRFQANRDLMIWEDQPSSSLDPSACHQAGRKSKGAKMALDATIPWDGPAGPRDPQAYTRVNYFEDDSSIA